MADTSVAIPLLAVSHEEHGRVSRCVGRRRVRLAAHATLETYSVLTRLPGDARLLPSDAALLLQERFGPPVTIGEPQVVGLVDELARLGIAGGAAYDALIAATASATAMTLLTRDVRAVATYQKLHAVVEIITS